MYGLTVMHRPQLEYSYMSSICGNIGTRSNPFSDVFYAVRYYWSLRTCVYCLYDFQEIISFNTFAENVYVSQNDFIKPCISYDFPYLWASKYPVADFSTD